MESHRIWKLPTWDSHRGAVPDVTLHYFAVLVVLGLGVSRVRTLVLKSPGGYVWVSILQGQQSRSCPELSLKSIT